MSIVVAQVLEGVTYIGADSAVTELEGCDQQLDTDLKLFMHNNVVYAAVGTPEHAAGLRRFVEDHEDQIELNTRSDVQTFMASWGDWLDIIGIPYRDDDGEITVSVAIATNERLWFVEGIYVTEIKKNLVFGCGSPYARGALYAGADVETALRAACKYDKHCLLPLVVFEIPTYATPSMTIIEE